MTKFGRIITAGIAATLAAGMATPSALALDKRPQETRSLAYATQPSALNTPVLMQAAQAAPAPQIAMPAPEALIVMIRSSVVALGHANTTNNYTVLNQMGSANFRKENSAQKLSQIFTPFRSNKIDLAPVVFLTPQLTQAPKIENGRLRLIGFFPSRPMQVNFDLMFEPSEGVWKMYGLAVDLKKVAAQPAKQFVPGTNAQPKGALGPLLGINICGCVSRKTWSAAVCVQEDADIYQILTSISRISGDKAAFDQPRKRYSYIRLWIFCWHITRRPEISGRSCSIS